MTGPGKSESRRFASISLLILRDSPHFFAYTCRAAPKPAATGACAWSHRPEHDQVSYATLQPSGTTARFTHPNSFASTRQALHEIPVFPPTPASDSFPATLKINSGGLEYYRASPK